MLYFTLCLFVHLYFTYVFTLVGLNKYICNIGFFNFSHNPHRHGTIVDVPLTSQYQIVPVCISFCTRRQSLRAIDQREGCSLCTTCSHCTCQLLSVLIQLLVQASMPKILIPFIIGICLNVVMVSRSLSMLLATA